ncbi:ATPase, F1/V1/A1 complex, alpha/beta subunit [Tanacetum coccineum]
MSKSDGTLDATPCTTNEVLSPTVVDETMEKEKLIQVGKYGLDPSMFSSSTRLFSFQFCSIDGLDAMLENGLCFIRNNPCILRKWHPDENLLKEYVSTIPVWVKLHGVLLRLLARMDRSSYAKAMIELRADVELKDNIVAATPKITGEGYYTCNIHVEYEWKPPWCVLDMFLWNVQRILSTTNTCGKNKNNSEFTKEVSKSHPFEVLNSVDNDVDLGTNGGISNSADKGTSKLMFVDDDGNPLVPTGIVDSDSEVEVLFDETANLRLSTSGKVGCDKGYGTNRLLEQWRDSYPDNDDYNPYDDDMYENHEMSAYLQSICDDLDITVCDRKKK